MVGLAVIVAVHSSLCTLHSWRHSVAISSATPYIVAAGSESNRVEADTVMAGEVG